MTSLHDELNKLKDEISRLSSEICEQLPTLLAVLDFRKTQNIELTRARLKDGWYGSFADGKYTAPTVGVYVGFLTDIEAADRLKETILGD
jgi:hypothetical protein